jgi:protein SCO1/2
MSWRALAIAFAGGILVAAAGWFFLPPRDDEQRSAAELMDVVMWNREPIGGPFALIDHNGHPRTDADFRGKFMLIYFGFTFCSDVCPTDLQSIATALDRLGTAGEAIQPLFITVDPEKDTPDQLKGYVALFHPRLIGLTGDARQIRQVARAYKVYYARTEPTRKGVRYRPHGRYLPGRRRRKIHRISAARHLGRAHDRGRPPAARRAVVVLRSATASNIAAPIVVPSPLAGEGYHSGCRQENG